MDIIESSSQFIHLHVLWKGHINWFVTIVYASTSYVNRQNLWGDLSRVADGMVDPWVVLGDFNVILAYHERKGGSSNFSSRGMQNFRDMVQSCNLLDAGFQGSSYTWKHGICFRD